MYVCIPQCAPCPPGFPWKPFFLSTSDRFSVLEMQLRYAHKKTLSLWFNVANPGIATNVVKD